MTTLFTFWHYVLLLVILLILAGGVMLALKEENSKYRVQIIFAFFLVSIFLALVGLYTVDKGTKITKLYKFENRRNLTTEKIMFSGMVKNEGKYEIGKVYLEITLQNNSKSTGGDTSKGAYFVPSGLLNSFLGFGVEANKPSQIVEEFIIAENLKPGEVDDFIVYMRYPAYFQGFSVDWKLVGH